MNAPNLGNSDQRMRLTRLLMGVPKYRTSKPKKQTRKFSVTRVYSPQEHLINCGSCGSAHLVNTMCMQCYQQIRQVTNEIKRRMMMYNPYVGERQRPLSPSEIEAAVRSASAADPAKREQPCKEGVAPLKKLE